VNVHIGQLRPEHAGEVMTIQRAAYLQEARRYGAWDLPPLVETLDQVRAHLADGTPAFGAFSGSRLVGSVRSRVGGERMEVVWLFTGAESDGNIAFYESAGFVRVSEHLDAVGIRCVTLEQKVI
jgi:hypothetical protein